MSAPTISDLIESINREEGYYLAGAARELWPVLVNHLDELNEGARACVEHYAAHLPSCRTYDEAGGCEGCRAVNAHARPCHEIERLGISERVRHEVDAWPLCPDCGRCRTPGQLLHSLCGISGS